MPRIPEALRDQIIGEKRLRGRTYYLIKCLDKSKGRKGLGETHFQAYSAEAPAGDGLCVLYEFERRAEIRQHVGILQELGRNPLGNFPHVRESFPQGDHHYLVTEWVTGRTLHEYLRGARKSGNQGEKSASTCMVVGLFHHFAQALCALHRRRNMIHGDLKPENLVVRDSHRLAMIDFGSSWRAERTVGRDDGHGNNEAYAAPETRRKGAFVDFRADIFSASVIFFEMLTLQLPYGKSGGAAAPEYVDTYVPPSVIAGKWAPLTDSTWKIIDRLATTGLKLDPEHRYASGSAWKKDLDALNTAMARHLSRESEANPLPFFGLLRWARDLFS